MNPEGTVDCRTNQCDIDDVSFPSAAILSPACYNGSEKRFPFAEPILTPCDMCEGVVPTLEGLDDEDTCQNTCADIVFKKYPFPSSLQVIKKCDPLCVDIFEALRGCDTCDSSPTCVPRWGNGQQIVFCCADPPCCDTSPTCVPPVPSVSGTPSVEPSGNTPSGGGPTHEPSFIPTSIPLPGGDYCTYAPDPSCYSNDGKPDCCMDDSECPYDEPPCDVVSSAPPTPQSTDTSIIPSQGPTPESTDTSFIPTTLDFDDNEPQLIFCCPVRPEPSPSCDTCDSSPTCVPRWVDGQQLVFCCADPPCCDTSPSCVPRWGDKQLVFCCPLRPTPCQDVGLCTLFAEPEPEPIEPTPSCETCDKSDDCVPEFEVFGSEVQQVVFCCADPPCCDSSPTCKPEYGDGTQIGFCCPCAVCEEVVPKLAEFGNESKCKRKCAGIVEEVAGAVSTISKVAAECDQLCVDIYEENCLLENVCSRVGLCVPEPILPAYCFSCEEEIPILEEAGVDACVETCREINNGLGAFCAPICNAIFQVFGVVIPKVICQYVGLCSILKQCDADKVIAPDALISIRESFNTHGDLCFGKTQMLTSLDFLNSKVTENTLHEGNGADSKLVYEDIGIVRDKAINLIVTVASGEYTTTASQKNGKNQGGDGMFGQIIVSVKPNQPESGEGTFEFCFHDKESNDKVVVDSFEWSVYDLDQQGNGIEETLIIDLKQVQDYQLWPNTQDSEVKLSCESGGLDSTLPCDSDDRVVFHSSTYGTGLDNPTDKDALTNQQLKRSIQFTFVNQSCFTFTFKSYCPPDVNDPDNSQGCSVGGEGAFLFAGGAKQLIEEGECITQVSGIRDSFEEIFSDEACFIGSKKVVPLNDEFAFLSSVAPISNCPDLYTHCYWKQQCEFDSQCSSVPPGFAPFTCKAPPGLLYGRCYEGPFPLCVLLSDGTYKVECT